MVLGHEKFIIIILNNAGRSRDEKEWGEVGLKSLNPSPFDPVVRG